MVVFTSGSCTSNRPLASSICSRVSVSSGDQPFQPASKPPITTRCPDRRDNSLTMRGRNVSALGINQKRVAATAAMNNTVANTEHQKITRMPCPDQRRHDEISATDCRAVCSVANVGFSDS